MINEPQQTKSVARNTDQQVNMLGPNIQIPAPSWLVSSVGRALHRYRRGHGFKSRTALNFFQVLFSTTRFISVLGCEHFKVLHVTVTYRHFFNWVIEVSLNIESYKYTTVDLRRFFSVFPIFIHKWSFQVDVAVNCGLYKD